MLTNHNDVNGRHCSQCDRRQTEATLLSRGASYENVSGTSQETPPHPLSRKQQWNRTNRRAYSPHPYAFHHCSCSCSSSSHSSRSNLLYVEVNKARGEALGLTLRSSKSGRCIVGRIINGGLIHKTGLLHVRDEILEINGNPITAHSIEDVQQYIMFVRAMFNYNSMEDLDLPCPEIGLSFNVGDILEIVDASDFPWWQARLRASFFHQHKHQHPICNAQETNQSARLIPSSDLQESRVSKTTTEAQEALTVDVLHNGTSFSSLLSLFIPRRRKSGEDRSIGSTSSSSAAHLQRALSRWMPFHHRGRTMAAPQPPPPLTRPPLKRTQSSPAQQSRSLDIFDFALDEEMIDERSSHNGALFRDFSGAGSNPTSQTCSRCNSTGEPSITGNERRKKWVEWATFLFSELPFHPYEEVVLVSSFRHRSLVILGARGVGRRTLRKALVRSRPDLFGTAIPHTTRKPEPHEKNGVNYFFVEQDEIASDIVSKEFLEYGQHKNILFGTRLDSVRSVIAAGRMPVLDVEPKALRILRSAEFAPIVILVAPPCLSLLIRDSQHDMLNSSLAKLTRESEIIEYVYWPYIDQVVVHHNVEDSTQEIIDYVSHLETTEQWVPITWVY